MAELYREQNVSRFASCAWALPRLLASAATDAPAFWSPGRQGLIDRVAGTVVAVAREHELTGRVRP